MFEIINVNGISVILSSMPGFSTTGLGVFVRAGARFEDKTVKGIAHFTEHMLFKGTDKFSYKDIKQEIEGRGGSLNGYTAQESAAYYAQFLKKNLEVTFDILGDMVTRPGFDQKEIEKERNVVLEELKMYNDLPHFRALSLLDQQLWPDHPLGQDIIGTVDSVKKIGRKDFQSFKNRFYRPEHMCICCVGDVPRDKLVFLVKNKFSSSGKKKIKFAGKQPQPLKGRKIAAEHKPLDQTHLCLGFRGVSYKDEFRFEEELLHVVLGANMSSRLFEEVREKRGLCYDVSTDTKKFADSGAFIIHCGLDEKNVPLALARIIRELKKIKKRLAGKRELERAKDYLLGQLSMSLERTGGRMFYCAESYLNQGKILSFFQLEQRIRRIEPEALTSLADKIFNFDKMCISCVGNVDDNINKTLSRVVDQETR